MIHIQMGILHYYKISVLSIDIFSQIVLIPMASFICFFQILENWKVSKIIFQFLEKCFSNFPIFGKMIFHFLENKLKTFPFFKNWKKQMNEAKDL